MSEPRKARLKVDLSPLELGVVECDAYICYNLLDQPESITLFIADDMFRVFHREHLDIRDVFGVDTFSAALEDGSHITGKLAFVKSTSSGPINSHIECYISCATCVESYSSVLAPRWVFRLANYCVGGFGDRMTEYKSSNDSLVIEKGQHRNRLMFMFSQREWTLDDDLYGRWPKGDFTFPGPVVSGTLSTEQREGDTESVLNQAARAIEDLLSLALGGDIKWVQLRHPGDAGMQIQYRKPGLLSFNHRWSALAGNWVCGNVRLFMESCEKSYFADQDWWSITIDLLTQVRGVGQLEVKCTLLNTLLDRITAKVNGDRNEAVIDQSLPDRIDRKWFRCVLHFLLRTLSRKWERHRTDTLCDVTIKGWNSELSFPDKVARACDLLGVQALSRSQLGLRHKLIHTGELDKKLKSTDKKVEYLFGVESLVMMLLIRMLGFEGYIYLPSHPSRHKKVSEFLVPVSEQNVGL